jgi:NAD(P)-dependent dehydrogenase (short-subunit alcohol dehydrogenase family)
MSAPRRVVVMGGSSVLGNATAQLLQREGSSVWATYHDPGRGTELAQVSPAIRWSRVDVTDWQAVQAFRDEVRKDWDGLDGLVCAFGMGLMQPAHLASKERVEECVSLNIEGVLATVRAFFPLLAKGRLPAVVLFSSIMGIAGAGGMSAYSATKGAVAALARALAVEWAPKSIRVNALAPGVVPSPLVEKMFGTLTPAQVEAIRERHLLGFGEPDDVAHAAAFLLGEPARWITGVVLPVDGGYTAH